MVFGRNNPDWAASWCQSYLWEIQNKNRSFPTYSKHTVAAAVVVAIVAKDAYVCVSKYMFLWQQSSAQLLHWFPIPGPMSGAFSDTSTQLASLTVVMNEFKGPRLETLLAELAKT